MSPGTVDLILLTFVFVGLQTFWLIPIIKKNKIVIERGKELKGEIRKLENLYKK